jgi:hypothetical protein
MKTNEIEFTIRVKTNFLDQETYEEILRPFLERIVQRKGDVRFSIDDLIKLLELDKKNFLVTLTEFPTLDRFDDGLKTTKINIVG